VLRLLAALVTLFVAVSAAALAPAAQSKKHGTTLEFRGQVIFPTGTTFQSTNVGGLSSKLLLVSDNNFAAAQLTQFLLFAVSGREDDDD
jgi:hypothetical protein